MYMKYNICENKIRKGTTTKTRQTMTLHTNDMKMRYFTILQIIEQHGFLVFRYKLLKKTFSSNN